jgi:hypothetical protein
MTIEELITFFFFSLYSWTAAFLAPLVLYTPCVLDCALRFFNDISFLLIKKKKKFHCAPWFNFLFYLFIFYLWWWWWWWGDNDASMIYFSVVSVQNWKFAFS